MARPQTENVLFNVGAAGARTLQFAIEPLPGETNRANNTLTRLVYVEPEPRRILYFEGEPRWEYKFIRRAAERRPDDPGRLDAAHHREQDLSAGHRQSAGAGRRLSDPGRRSVRATRR